MQKNINIDKTSPVLEYDTAYPFDIEYPSITTLPRIKYDDKTRLRLMRYLRNSDFVYIPLSFGLIDDAFTDEKMPANGTCLSDGIWTWIDDLWIYVRDYDIALPNEFVQHVNEFFDNEHNSVNLLPYLGRLVSNDGESEFLQHYKGRKNNYLWHEAIKTIEINKIDCFIDVAVFHLQFDLEQREAFFPVVVYIEDKEQLDRIYERLDFQLFLNGRINHENKKTKVIKERHIRDVYQYIKSLELDRNIDEFIKIEQKLCCIGIKQDIQEKIERCSFIIL